MKKILFLAVACLGLTIGMTSCGHDYDANPNDNHSQQRNPLLGKFKADVNGVPFVAEIKSYTDTTINDVRTVSVMGLKYGDDRSPNQTTSISISVNDFTGNKAYEVDGFRITGTLSYTDTNYLQQYSPVLGDTASFITFTNAGDHLTGTFNFRVVPVNDNEGDTITISNGYFDIPK